VPLFLKRHCDRTLGVRCVARGDVEAVVGVLGGEVREVHLDGGCRRYHILEGHVNTMIGHIIVLYYGHNMGTILSC
jgi:hypothetical protein